jgi:hypothetical protein
MSIVAKQKVLLFTVNSIIYSFILLLYKGCIDNLVKLLCNTCYNVILGQTKCYIRPMIVDKLLPPCGGGLEYFHRSPCES